MNIRSQQTQSPDRRRLQLARPTPDFVANAAQLACLLEASAEKPGNVTPSRAFQDMRFEDFLRSAVAMGPELGRAGKRSAGDTILAAIQATRRWTTANTNLGIVLLFAPLAKAALSESDPLPAAVSSVLADLTVHDAQQAYRAIRLAGPGGLEDSVAHDVRTEPTVTLLKAMASARQRDSIAAEYAGNFAITFEQGLPLLRNALARGLEQRPAVVQIYLELLATVPDTLIARKRSWQEARRVSEEARQVVAVGGVYSQAGRQAIANFDARLRPAEDNSLNPGTTADLVAATLFVALLTGEWS